MHQKVLLSVIDLRGTSGFHAGDGRDRFYSSKMVEGDKLRQVNDLGYLVLIRETNWLLPTVWI